MVSFVFGSQACTSIQKHEILITNSKFRAVKAVIFTICIFVNRVSVM